MAAQPERKDRDKDRARELFDQALDQAPDARAAFLARGCAGDADLRHELDSLLRLHDEAGQVLRDPTAPVTEQPGDHIGHYKLLQRIGEGGFGTVWMAEQLEPVRRMVALKVIKAGMDTAQVVARFEAERQALALMEHPNIARVFDGGATAKGRPYFVMELVRGVPVTQYCDEASLSPRERLELFIPVCQAVQHAHYKGVIHRDLKPSNVLVTLHDGVPVPKVIDFGVAKATQGRLTERTLFTAFQQMIGTPEYMAPEQAELSGLDVDTRADVYSLGVLLYELLTGTRPFDLKRLLEDGYAEMLRTIKEVEPQKPSTRVSTLGDRLADIARHRRLPPRALGPLMRGELDWIVMKTLEKERNRRYATATALAEDVQRHLRNEPVHAGPPSRIYKLRKYAQRHRVGVSVMVVIVGGTAVFLGALQSKNTELGAKNVELGIATTVAREKEAEATHQAIVAQREKANVLKLSAFQTLDDLTNEAEELWPAEPALVGRYREWIRKAEELVARLPEFRASLAEIEQRALPQTAEEERAREQERAWARSSHPRAGELAAKVAELGWMKRMLGEEPWPSETDVELALSKETLPADVEGLDALAWPLVNPNKPVYGSEVKALLLARRAYAAAGADDRPYVRETLAWAYFKLGRFDEALAEESHALEEFEPAEYEQYQTHVEWLGEAIDRWRDLKGAAHDQEDEARGDRLKEREELAQTVTALEIELSERRTWRFAKDAGGVETGDRWWHDQLLKLVASLESFEHPKTGLVRGVSETHGWGVAKRLEFAASVEERTLTSAMASDLWSEAIDEIAASSMYGGLELTPQLGLLPIGEDPHSGLWEFAHLQTGNAPERGPDGQVLRDEKGRLLMKANTGLVFVLVPGGTFWMGAQEADPNGRNYDPHARDKESPVHEVTLSPYFLSKYEMTEGQWERFTAKTANRARPHTHRSRWNKFGKLSSALHPAAKLTWTDCMDAMTRLGCELPTEAQWEYACRAGTSSAYWSGDGLEGLGEVANVSDAYAHEHGGEDWPGWDADVDDGTTVFAEIGSYRPNAFGLHDVHGNVWEWCRDGWEDYSSDKQLDPVTPWNVHTLRVIRGGSYYHCAHFARASTRGRSLPDELDMADGLRPALALRLPASRIHPQQK